MVRVAESLSGDNRSATPDRLAEIRARLDEWRGRTFTGSVADGLDLAARFTEDAERDLAYLLAEIDAARERIAILRAEVRDLEGIIGIASPHGHADPAGTSYQVGE